MYIFQTSQDQYKFVMPLSRDTEKLFYTQRIIIDGKVLTQPRSWEITKVNRISESGLMLITLAQEEFNQFADAFMDADGVFHRLYDNDYNKDNVVVKGWYANYFSNKTNVAESQPNAVINKTDREDVEKTFYGEITYSGLDSVLKVGGGYKKFTIKYYSLKDQSEVTSTNDVGQWTFELRHKDINTGELIVEDPKDLIQTILPDSNSTLESNQIKIKFVGDVTYIGSVLRITNTSGNVTTCLDVDITGL